MFAASSCIPLLLPRLPKLLSQCYSNGPGSIGNLGSSKDEGNLQHMLDTCIHIDGIVVDKLHDIL